MVLTYQQIVDDYSKTAIYPGETREERNYSRDVWDHHQRSRFRAAFPHRVANGKNKEPVRSNLNIGDTMLVSGPSGGIQVRVIQIAEEEALTEVDDEVDTWRVERVLMATYELIDSDATDPLPTIKPPVSDEAHHAFMRDFFER